MASSLSTSAMAVGGLQELKNAMINIADYPSNLPYPKAMENSLQVLKDQLGRRAMRLFCAEPVYAENSDADVNVWELYREDEGFHKTRVRDSTGLQLLLQDPIAQNRPDPRQRVFFIHAPHSRAQLSISQKMFLQILTYHNVMPAFLEFVFPFGKQHFARDFHLMGFRSESQLSGPIRGQAIPELGRSGRHIELCYSLKSVESSSDPPLYRSIRQCSVHHLLDLVSGQSTWIIIKANKVISSAVQEKVEEDRVMRSSSAEHEPSPLASTLGIHSIIAAWAGGNWHWYISELESYLQTASRQALSASWELPQSSPEKTQSKPPSPPQRSWTQKSSYHSQLSGSTLQGGSPRAPTRSNTLEGGLPSQQTNGFEDFSFQNLQNVQFVEEKANEVLLILKSNSNVLGDMVNEYRMVLANPSYAARLPKDFATAVTHFCSKIESIEKDMSLQIARVQTLLSFTAERKSLLNAVFQYRSMQASRLYAEKAQLSADRMEDMTDQMGIIAKKTEAETVSMRIITWVTLFFLPGTFMAALFSTPIIDFHQKGPESLNFSWANIGVGALKLYVIASLPLVILTLVAWWIMDYRAKHRDGRENEKPLKDKDDIV